MLERHETLVALVAGGPQLVETLADRLGCSVRTIYRDVVALQRAGVPIASSTTTISVDRSVRVAVTLSLDEIEAMLGRVAPDDAALLVARLSPPVAHLLTAQP